MTDPNNNNQDSLAGGSPQQGIQFGMMIAYTIMRVLGLSGITYLRQDFGRRYYSVGIYLAGVVILAIWTFGLGAFGKLMPGDIVRGRIPSMLSIFGGGYGIMKLFFWGYVIIGFFHVFRAWARDFTGAPIHSQDDGIGRLEKFAGMPMWIANRVAGFFIGLLSLLLPSIERKALNAALPVYQDKAEYTRRWLDATALGFTGLFLLPFGALQLGTWLCLSAFAVASAAALYEKFQQDRIINMRDKLLEAVHLKEAMHGNSRAVRIPETTKKIVKNTAEQIKKLDKPAEAVARIKQQTPNLAEAMASVDDTIRAMMDDDYGKPEPSKTAVSSDGKFVSATPAENGQAAANAAGA
jgi:hypothetical protein